MTPKNNSGNGGRPLAAEVVGAGPVGLMTANLLGLAGIRVLVLGRNAGLLGLPRAIAYDSAPASSPLTAPRRTPRPSRSAVIIAEWARRHDVRGVLVRPDRFIAARLDPGKDLDVLSPFAAALTAADIRVAA